MKPGSPLPQLPVWHARSFYALILSVLTALANHWDVDLMSFFASAGLGEDDRAVLDNIMLVAPYVFALWAYFERRRPRYQLRFFRRSNSGAPAE